MNWKRGRVSSLFRGKDDHVSGVEIIMYQPNLKQTIKVKRPLQLIVPFEINDRNTDVLTEQFEIVNEHNDVLTDEEPIATTKRPQRIAAKNADIIRRLLDQ